MEIRDELKEISKQRQEDKEECERLKKKYDEEFKKISEMASKRNSRLEKIIKRIESGESTGDAVFDFGIVCYIITDEKDIEKLRKLKEESGKNVDSPILVVTQNMRDIGIKYHSFMPSPHEIPEWIIETRKDLAILSAEAVFDLKAKKAVFPCKRGSVHKIEREKWALHQDNIALDSWILRNLGRTLDKDKRENYEADLGMFMAMDNRGLQIYFGEKDIENNFSGFQDYSYYAAMKLLGRKVPDKFKQGYAKSVEQDAARILNDISELQSKERTIASYIKGIEGNSPHGVYMSDDGERVTEIPKDKYLARDRKNLDSVRECIKKCLQQAVDACIFGLGIKIDDGTRVKPFSVDAELRRHAEDYDFKLEE